jgi:hypothetical protein
MRWLTTLSGNESNRDVFGALRGSCTACECSKFSPDVSQGTGWNAVSQLKCGSCGCPHTAHVKHCDELEVELLDEEKFVARTFSSRSVLRCADSLADFVRGYLPLHNLQEETWRLLPVLFWLEASIYTLDERNEEAIQGDQSAPQCDESADWKV